MAEVPRHGQASEEEMRAFARSYATLIFERPVSEWGGMDFAFLLVSSPLVLDEALSVALEREHREGVGAIAVSAHMQGAQVRRSDPEEAAQYAAVVDRITSGFTPE